MATDLHLFPVIASYEMSLPFITSQDQSSGNFLNPEFSVYHTIFPEILGFLDSKGVVALF